MTQRPRKLLEFAAVEQFTSELAALFQDPGLADDAASTIEWALIRRPDEGIAIPREPIWIYPLVIEGQEYVVFYQWEDHDKVELLSIRPGIE